MDRVGSQLVEEKKAETERLGNYSSKIGKDMLSTMIRANTTEHATTKLDDGTLLAGELAGVRSIRLPFQTYNVRQRSQPFLLLATPQRLQH